MRFAQLSVFFVIFEDTKMENMKFENQHERAKYLHSKIKNTFAKNQTTIAIGITEDDESIIGTSDNRLRKDVVNELNDDDIIATAHDYNHAEEDIIDEADNLQKKLKSIDASRPICSDCETKIKERNISTSTPFSGKQSRKRQNN